MWDFVIDHQACQLHPETHVNDDTYHLYFAYNGDVTFLRKSPAVPQNPAKPWAHISFIRFSNDAELACSIVSIVGMSRCWQ